MNNQKKVSLSSSDFPLNERIFPSNISRCVVFNGHYFFQFGQIIPSEEGDPILINMLNIQYNRVDFLSMVQRHERFMNECLVFLNESSAPSEDLISFSTILPRIKWSSFNSTHLELVNLETIGRVNSSIEFDFYRLDQRFLNDSAKIKRPAKTIASHLVIPIVKVVIELSDIKVLLADLLRMYSDSNDEVVRG